MRSAISIANYLYDLSESEGRTDFSLLKMLKMVYLVHGFTLGNIGVSALADDEVVEAWHYGPVVPNAYYVFKTLKDKNDIITGKVDPDTFKLDPTDRTELAIQLTCDIVWNMYKAADAFDLVDLLHRPGSPWTKCYKAGIKNIIPDNLTRQYYSYVWQVMTQSKTSND